MQHLIVLPYKVLIFPFNYYNLFKTQQTIHKNIKFYSNYIIYIND